MPTMPTRPGIGSAPRGGVGAAEQKRPKERVVNAERAKKRMASDKECRERKSDWSGSRRGEN